MKHPETSLPSLVPSCLDNPSYPFVIGLKLPGKDRFVTTCHHARRQSYDNSFCLETGYAQERPVQYCQLPTAAIAGVLFTSHPTDPGVRANSGERLRPGLRSHAASKLRARDLNGGSAITRHSEFGQERRIHGNHAAANDYARLHWRVRRMIGGQQSSRTSAPPIPRSRDEDSRSPGGLGRFWMAEAYRNSGLSLLRPLRVSERFGGSITKDIILHHTKAPLSFVHFGSPLTAVISSFADVLGQALRSKPGKPNAKLNICCRIPPGRPRSSSFLPPLKSVVATSFRGLGVDFARTARLPSCKLQMCTVMVN